MLCNVKGEHFKWLFVVVVIAAAAALVTALFSFWARVRAFDFVSSESNFTGNKARHIKCINLPINHTLTQTTYTSSIYCRRYLQHFICICVLSVIICFKNGVNKINSISSSFWVRFECLISEKSKWNTKKKKNRAGRKIVWRKNIQHELNIVEFHFKPSWCVYWILVVESFPLIIICVHLFEMPHSLFFTFSGRLGSAQLGHIPNTLHISIFTDSKKKRARNRNRFSATRFSRPCENTPTTTEGKDHKQHIVEHSCRWGDKETQ